MNVFFITPSRSFFDHQYRTTWMHSMVFHGTTDRTRLSQLDKPQSEQDPTSNGTECLSVLRSGTFVPDVWAPSTVDLVVAEHIANRLLQITKVQLRDVCFSKIVDLPMPALGSDVSWSRPGPIDPDQGLEQFPDSPELRKSIGKFKAINFPTIYKMRSHLGDKKRIRPNFGSYADGETFGNFSSKTVLFSNKFIQDNPLFWDEVFILREDVFSVIAPHIDRDYFWVAWKEVT
ncbi:hypothetical protein SH661x_004317 [Planctomicrobium sp. SH661]|uniref:hypothetical protein n=1 Tax=Planctomicrobium sp. SH661 TaxID=3448124 RepID=UPI003F5B6DCC